MKNKSEQEQRTAYLKRLEDAKRQRKLDEKEKQALESISEVGALKKEIEKLKSIIASLIRGNTRQDLNIKLLKNNVQRNKNSIRRNKDNIQRNKESINRVKPR